MDANFELLDAALDLIALIDVQSGHILRLNKAAQRMLGYAPEELIGRHYSMLFRDEAGDGAELLADNPLVQGGVFTAQELLRADGSVCPVDITATIVPWQGDHALLVNLRDVTERKETEQKLADAYQALEQSRDDMLAILDQMRIGTALTDAAGYLVFVSRVAKELFGAKIAAAHGKPWQKILPLSKEEREQIESMAARAPRERAKIPLHIQSDAGRRYWVESEIYDDPRDPQRKIFCFYDVSEIHDLRRILEAKASFHEIIGRSKPMQRVFDSIQNLASADVTVLIEGETGTGKELVARAIHQTSRRRDKPFIAVNCAGLTDSLIGSQLFGHRRGSFTGAIADQQGLFEAANGGTIFLDEIGDIPQSAQTNLLRVLQEREIVRIGEHSPRKVDVRVVAATNRDLAKEVAAGHFRQDLFYRIRVGRIQLPALRDRREDIPLLVGEFLRLAGGLTGKKVREVNAEAMKRMIAYDWPGNVRELKSAIDVAVINCKGAVLNAEDLPEESRPRERGEIVAQSPEEERQALLDAIDRAGGNRGRAAQLLGISRATLYRRLDAHKID